MAFEKQGKFRSTEIVESFSPLHFKKTIAHRMNRGLFLCFSQKESIAFS